MFQVDEVKQKSIFPIDNYELIYGDWERKIIWDSQNMDYYSWLVPNWGTGLFRVEDLNMCT